MKIRMIEGKRNRGKLREVFDGLTKLPGVRRVTAVTVLEPSKGQDAWSITMAQAREQSIRQT